MANKAVVLGAATVAGLYYFSERGKEAAVQKELQEERQRQHEREEQWAHRMKEEEESRKTGNKNNIFGSSASAMIEFSRYARFMARDQLLDLLRDIRDAAKKRFAADLYLANVHLPLLKGQDQDTNSPEEIVFGAALALGDEAVLRMLFEEEIILWSPTLAVTNLTLKSITFIRKQFDDFAKRRNLLADLGLPNGNANQTAQVDLDLIMMILHRIVFKPSSDAFLMPFEVESHYQLLTCKALALGFGLRVEAAISYKNRTFGPIGPHQLYRINYMRDSKAKHFQGGECWLMNFSGGFSVPAEFHANCFRWHPSRDPKPSKDGAVFPIKEEHQNLAAKLLSRLMSMRTADEASLRLRGTGEVMTTARLIGHVSTELISIGSGLDGMFLSSVRDDTIKLIEKNTASVAANLKAQLGA
ncbi:MAG: hypothetical protein SGILL_007515, partial [Bacillariaceae sp.]